MYGDVPNPLAVHEPLFAMIKATQYQPAFVIAMLKLLTRIDVDNEKKLVSAD